MQRIKDQFWNACMMLVTPITDNDVVLWKICYDSQTQEVNSHAKSETSCYLKQVMLWQSQMIGYNEYIPLLIRQMNEAGENLNCTIFDVRDSTLIFCKLLHA